ALQQLQDRLAHRLDRLGARAVRVGRGPPRGLGRADQLTHARYAVVAALPYRHHVRVRVGTGLLVLVGDPDPELPVGLVRVDRVDVPRCHLTERVEQELVVLVRGVVQLDVRPPDAVVVNATLGGLHRGEVRPRRGDHLLQCGVKLGELVVGHGYAPPGVSSGSGSDRALERRTVVPLRGHARQYHGTARRSSGRAAAAAVRSRSSGYPAYGTPWRRYRRRACTARSARPGRWPAAPRPSRRP